MKLSRGLQVAIVLSGAVSIVSFQNCSGGFNARELSSISSLGTSSQINVNHTIANLNFSIGDQDLLVESQTYQLSASWGSAVIGNVDDVVWTIVSTPAGACELVGDIQGPPGVSPTFHCVNGADIVISAEGSDSGGRFIDRLVTQRKVVTSQELLELGNRTYSQACAACHSSVSNSTKRDATAEEIVDSLISQPLMRDDARLQNLTSSEIHALALALSWTVSATPTPTPRPTATPVPTSTPTPTPISGTQLYSQHCADCHGPVAFSGVGFSSGSQIAAAIRNRRQMDIPALKALTPAQVSAIAVALGGKP